MAEEKRWFESALNLENHAKELETQAECMPGRPYEGLKGHLRVRATALRGIAEAHLFKAVNA